MGVICGLAVAGAKTMAALLLAGCGKMGGALLAGWLDRGMRPADIVVVEPDAKTARLIRRRHKVTVVASPGAALEIGRAHV